MNILKFIRTSRNAKAPSKAHPSDSGFDLYTLEETLIPSGGTRVIGTGVKIALPTGYEAQIRPRSGISAKTNLVVMLGTIDQNFLGELGIIVKNLGSTDEVIPAGYKLAQLVPQKLPEFCLEEVSSFDTTTDRGTSGFGASGV